MKTSINGVEMEATATVRFRFAVGKVGARTAYQEVGLDLDELLSDPQGAGEMLRSAWFGARSEAAAELQRAAHG